MATLTGLRINQTYDGLLKFTDNSPVDGTLREITDGLGNDVGLQLSNNTVRIKYGWNFQVGDSNVSGTQAYAIGNGNTVNANFAGALGENNNVTGNFSRAVGQGNTISGGYASAVGQGNTTSGLYSGAFGRANQVQKMQSFAFGSNNNTNAFNSTLIGQNNNSTGTQSNGIGVNNTLIGQNSIALGRNNTINTKNSFAFGFDNIVGKSGDDNLNMYAFGFDNQIENNNNFAFGKGLTSPLESGDPLAGTSNQTLVGQFNINSKTNNAIIFGTGTSDGNRQTSICLKKAGFKQGNRTSGMSFQNLKDSTSYADDAAAAAGFVEIGELYRNGNDVKIRMT
jgi:hypothetical protein